MGKRVEGKVAIVTGGGTGIGRGIALMLGREGAKVVVAGRRPDPLEKTMQDIIQAGGVASYVSADVTKEADCERMVSYTVETYGGLDVLVSNAGIFPRASLPQTTETLWNETVDVNLKGHFLCSKYAVPAMIERGGGSIVFTGSVHGYTGGAELVAYSAAKGGLWTMTRNLARTYAPQCIRINYINPGWVASEGEIELRRGEGHSEDWLQERGRQLPMRRLQTPEDSAYVALFLASDESGQVTATRFNVDGGLSVTM